MISYVSHYDSVGHTYDIICNIAPTISVSRSTILKGKTNYIVGMT
jgi:hypothetical protein